MADQIEMSSAENIFGSVPNFLTPKLYPDLHFHSILELLVKHLILHGHLSI